MALNARILMNTLQKKHKTLSSDECSQVHEAQSTFWNEWKVKLEQQKTVADKSRLLEKLISGVETCRFFSGDMDYIQSIVFSLIDSVKTEKKQILKDALVLSHTYGLDRNKVLLYYLRTVLISEIWSVDDIMEEVLDYKQEILASAVEVIKSISLLVYPVIDGYDKQRLAFIYDLLSDWYTQLDLCFIVGYLCRQFQECRVVPTGGDEDKEGLGVLFVRLLFPCFVAELVKADQPCSSWISGHEIHAHQR